jgi:thiamine pyrophosphate-dependent acetolactate synthase large subunit-like protein
LGKSMGVPGSRVTSLEGFSKALREGFEHEGPTLIEVPL